MFIAALCEYQ